VGEMKKVGKDRLFQQALLTNLGGIRRLDFPDSAIDLCPYPLGIG